MSSYSVTDELEEFDVHRDVAQVHKFLKGTKEKVLEIFCRRTHEQINEICSVYKDVHEVNLQDQLTSKYKGDQLRFLYAVSKSYPTFLALCMRTEPANGKLDEAFLHDVLLTESTDVIKNMEFEYEKIYEKTLASEIQKDIIHAGKEFYLRKLKNPAPEDETVDEAQLKKDVLKIGAASKTGLTEMIINYFAKSSRNHLYSFTNQFQKLHEVTFLEYIKNQPKPLVVIVSDMMLNASDSEFLLENKFKTAFNEGNSKIFLKYLLSDKGKIPLMIGSLEIDKQSMVSVIQKHFAGTGKILLPILVKKYM